MNEVVRGPSRAVSVLAGTAFLALALSVDSGVGYHAIPESTLTRFQEPTRHVFRAFGRTDPIEAQRICMALGEGQRRDVIDDSVTLVVGMLAAMSVRLQ